jgi:hypothetical protein
VEKKVDNPSRQSPLELEEAIQELLELKEDLTVIHDSLGDMFDLTTILHARLDNLVYAMTGRISSPPQSPQSPPPGPD